MVVSRPPCAPSPPTRVHLPWRAALLTTLVLSLICGAVIGLMDHYHVFGTDRTGNDVLYQAFKSVRTAFVIGTLATVATLPFAVGLGLLAGYFRGWVDEVIQYAYTTLSSVPNVSAHRRVRADGAVCSSTRTPTCSRPGWSART